MATAALCACLALVTGCGSSSRSLAAKDAARLHRDVAGIRSASAGRNPAAAHEAVKVFEADVTRLQAAGRLAPADATALMRDAARVDHRVALDVHPPPPSAPAAPAAPASPGPGGHGDHGHHGGGGGGGDNGNGNGNGDGGGDGGD